MNTSRILIITVVSVIALAVWWMKVKIDTFVTVFENKQSRMISLPKEALVISPPELEKKPETSLSEVETKIVKSLLLRYQSGDYNTALSILSKTLATPGISEQLRAWLDRQHPALLISSAWVDIKSSNCSDAIPKLKQAEQMQTSEALVKGLAVCYYRNQDWPGAEEYAKQSLKQNPKSKEMLLIYADVLESEMRYDEAITQLSALTHVEPTNTAFQDRLASMREKAKEGYKQVTLSSRYINLIYRAVEHERLADFVLATLDDTVEEYVDMHGFVEPEKSIEVILYPGDNFNKVVNNGPDWASGIFDGRIRLPIYDSYSQANGLPAFARVLRHELVHALFAMQTGFRPLPYWFNEGIAQRLECSEGCPTDFFPANPGDFLGAEDLTNAFTDYDRLKAERSYRQSLYLILTLERDHDFGGDQTLRRLVRSLRKSNPLTSEDLLKPFQISFNELLAQAKQLWQARHQF